MLVLTTFDHDDVPVRRAGRRRGRVPPEELDARGSRAAAVRRCAGGDAVLDPAVTAGSSPARPPAAATARAATRALGGPVRPSSTQLTEREKDVLRLLTRGRDQRRDRRRPRRGRGHRQDPRVAGAHQARRPRPGAGRDPRLRDRLRGDRPPGRRGRGRRRPRRADRSRPLVGCAGSLRAQRRLGGPWDGRGGAHGRGGPVARARSARRSRSTASTPAVTS